MAEFRFDIKPLFPEPIVKVSSNLLPHTFRGDRRQCLDATSKMSEIIDRLGQLSAVAQKLTKPVTTAQRLRMSENQIVYLMADVNENHNGAVIGLLKVGTKDLYLFDEVGQTSKVDNTPCILDFYIHESRQRAGLGKQLFETMLHDQQWRPIKCSIDRPSEKLLGFFKKHYGLTKSIPQANNFVLYEGFFNESNGGDGANKQANGSGLHITNGPNTKLFGAQYVDDDDANKKRVHHSDTTKPTQITQINSSMGRYGARRPTCSMAEKTASDVSLTPSQAAEQAKLNARKNPLDALSRLSLRPESFEKRSGLQDVDEEYLKQNVFAKPAFPKHSGLNEQHGSKKAMSLQQIQQHYQQNAAGINNHQQQQQQQQQQQPPPLSQTESTFKLQTSADGNAGLTPSQAQLQQSPSTMQAQQQQQNCKNPSYKESSHTGGGAALGAGATGGQPQAGGGAAGNVPVSEPEMCTTCPNCQATIYLVRAPEASHGYEIIHNDTANKGAAKPSSNVDIETITINLQDLQTTDGTDGNENDNNGGEKLDLTTQLALATERSEMYELPLGATAEMESTADDYTVNVDEEVKLDITVNEKHPSNSNKAATSSVIGSETITIKKPMSFKLSKQHTGMKNISFGVGLAVTPSGKMEFDQESRTTGKLISPPPPMQDNTDAVSTVSSSEGLTDQGYHDLKFFHNKLW